jgi:glycosyltransferase involved in cell wall biosynthesis
MSPDSPIRCAQLIEALDVGGAESLAVRIGNAMAVRGHESHIIVIGRAGDTARRILPQVALHELGFARESVTRPVAFVRSVVSGYRAMRGLLREHRIQVVQSHLPGANFWGLLLALGGGVRVLPTVHNNQEFNYGDADNRLRARARRLAYKAMTRACPAVIAVSDEVKQSLVADCALNEAAAGRIAVVRNGVEIPAVLSVDEREVIRRAFGLPPGHFVFLAAGRHCEQKNLGDLIQAADLLTGEDRPWLLVIAGDGPMRAELEVAAASGPGSGRIRFTGNVMNLSELMACADAFVLPSLWEGLPLVLLEAMAQGLPVIGNRIPGVVDVVSDGRDGLLATPRDAADLARAMRVLLRDGQVRDVLGSGALATVTRDFDFRSTIIALERLYRDCTHRHRTQE